MNSATPGLAACLVSSHWLLSRHDHVTEISATVYTSKQGEWLFWVVAVLL